MKIELKDLARAVDFIAKDNDGGRIQVTAADQGNVFDGLFLNYSTSVGEKVTITIPANEKAFCKITRTERF